MKIDVCAKIPDERVRAELCKTIESITGQGWSNFDGRVNATYIGDDEEIVKRLIELFDNDREHEIVLDRGYRT